MALFQIGPFDFINLSRAPSGSMLTIEREVRPGVPGVTFWGVGRHSEPYAVASVRDVQDADAGHLTLAAYEAIVGTGPVQLVWNGRPRQVIVHRVEPLDNGVYQTLIGLGGILGTSNGMLRCAWLLEDLPVQEQQQQ